MPETRATATPLQVTAAVVIVLVGVAETWRFLGWNFDDAYIVFRIARNLAAGHGWGFNAGEAHNASTSVLNTLTTAGAAVAFQSIPLAAHWINALWIIASGLIVAHVFARRFPAAEWLGLAAGVGIVCTLAENSTWGLETSLFFFLLMVVVLLEDIGRPSWVAIGLLTLTRPDGALVAGFRWLRGLMHRQLSMKGLAQFLAVLSPWVIYSLVRFHQVFPDTLANKIWQGRSGFWGTGHVYWQALASHVFAPNAVFTAVFVLAVPGMYFLIRDRSALLYVVTLAIAQQAAYGVPIRMALISLMLGVAKDGAFETFEDGFRGSHTTLYQQPRDLGIKCSNSNCIVHDPFDGKYTRNKFHLIEHQGRRLRCLYCERDIPDFVVANKKQKTFEPNAAIAGALPKNVKDTVFFAGAAQAEAAGYTAKPGKKAAST